MPSASARWCTGGQAKVLKDLARDPLVVNEGLKAHRPAAAPALENVEREDPFQQLCPVQPPRPKGVGGTVVHLRPKSKTKLRISSRLGATSTARGYGVTCVRSATAPSW